MKIEWVNHASFVMQHEGVRFITDPWLMGKAFDNGWDLLCDAVFQPEDFRGITHIWISHEHPDHFSPATLRAIPEETRHKLTVLYQETADKKVIEFCKDLGFGRVVELPPGRWHQLSESVRVMCAPFPEDDSWLAIEAGDEVLLNINDCMVQYPWQAEAIRDRVARPIDVLLTQFSYASWVGNREDRDAHRRMAEKLYERIGVQCDVLQPRYAIPFASFVWFCHEENWYLNAEMNTVGGAYRFLKEETEATPIVLYPGETWQVGEAHDSEASIARYEPHYARVSAAEGLVRSEPVPMERLRDAAEEYRRQVNQQHGRITLRALEAAGLLKPAHIYLTDHRRSVAFSTRRGLRGSRRPREACDVELSSDALHYCFRYLWGGNTLQVNGRFQAPPGGDFARFRRHLVLGDFANHGKHIVHYLRPQAERGRKALLQRLQALIPASSRGAGRVGA